MGSMAGAVSRQTALIPKALLADSPGDSRIAAGLIQVGARGFAPWHQRSDCERTIRRRRCVGSPADRGTSTRADGLFRWQGFETEWTEGRPRGSAAGTARPFPTG